MAETLLSLSIRAYNCTGGNDKCEFKNSTVPHVAFNCLQGNAVIWLSVGGSRSVPACHRGSQRRSLGSGSLVWVAGHAVLARPHATTDNCCVYIHAYMYICMYVYACLPASYPLPPLTSWTADKTSNQLFLLLVFTWFCFLFQLCSYSRLQIFMIRV